MSETANPTYFDGKKSFKDVPVVDGEISTNEFLEACESLTKLFSLLGSGSFSMVQSDMNGNIKKIRDRMLSHPAQSETLQALVKNEVAEKKKTATEGLLWLNRGLSFTAVALRNTQSNPTQELSVAFQGAYGDTLKKHHSWLVTKAFSAAMGLCPSRKVFFTELQNGHTDEPTADKVQAQLEEWLTSLDLCVNILNKWIEGVKF